MSTSWWPEWGEGPDVRWPAEGVLKTSWPEEEELPDVSWSCDWPVLSLWSGKISRDGRGVGWLQAGHTGPPLGINLVEPNKYQIYHPKCQICYPKIQIFHPKYRIGHPKYKTHNTKQQIHCPKYKIQSPSRGAGQVQTPQNAVKRIWGYPNVELSKDICQGLNIQTFKIVYLI